MASGRPLERLRSRHAVTLLVLAGIAWLVLMAGNGLLSLTDPDEVFYAETAREMLQHRTWTVPYIFDAPQFEKPILYYALTAAGFKAWGDTAGTARLWPGVFALAGVLATYICSFLMFRDRLAAFLAAIVLATSVIYVALAHTVMTDMVFSVWILLALAGFYSAYATRRMRAAGTLVFFVASALAVLTKGLLGAVFPFGIMLLYLAWRRDMRWLGNWWVPAGFVLFLAIAVPWHLAMYRSYGHQFVHEYFWNVHVRRILEAEHRRNDTWYFYLVTIFGGIFPWSLFLFPAGRLTGATLRDRESAARSGVVFCLIWIGVVLIVMQLAHSKLMSYILPLFPAVAIVIGLCLATALHERGGSSAASGGARPAGARSVRLIGFVMAAITLAGAVGAVFAVRRGLIPAGGNTAVVIVALALAAGAAGLAIFAATRRAVGVIACLALVTPAILAGGLFARSVAEPLASSRDACRQLVAADSTNSMVLSSQLFVRGVRFYTGRPAAVIGIKRRGFFSPHPIPFLDTDDRVAFFLSSQPVTSCLLRGADLRDVERIAAARGFTILSRQLVGNRWVVRVGREGPPPAPGS